MADNWDDSDDEWDVDDDALDNKLGLKKADEKTPAFDDEEDLTAKEKAENEKVENTELRKKGTALQARKQAEKERKEEEELARKVLELELEAEANMTADELRAHKQRQVEQADNALTNDLFGGNVDGQEGSVAAAPAGAPGDRLVLKDLKDHLKHAGKVSEAINGNGKIHLAAAFIKEVIEGTKDVLDEDAVNDIIKILNAIKNDKVQAAKRKVKGQAQKSKKVDKAAAAKARQVQIETFGDNDEYDDYDHMGANYEDSFF